MNLLGLFDNRVLLSALAAWGLAQLIKVPLEYLFTRKWNWAILINAGGMPSSHSALIAATTQGIGLWYGFETPLFALGVAVCMVVIYDATGIRRQAGLHAELLNKIVDDFVTTGTLGEGEQKQLKEVLGHTPREAFGGLVLGIIVPTLIWLIWR